MTAVAVALRVQRDSIRFLVFEVDTEPSVHFFVEMPAVLGLQDPMPGIGPDE
jgi:hypothetical protein